MQNVPICKYWNLGNCKNGESCHFCHPSQQGMHSHHQQQQQHHQQQNQKQHHSQNNSATAPSCKYFPASCRKGDHCPFFHDFSLVNNNNKNKNQDNNNNNLQTNSLQQFRGERGRGRGRGDERGRGRGPQNRREQQEEGPEREERVNSTYDFSDIVEPLNLHYYSAKTPVESVTFNSSSTLACFRFAEKGSRLAHHSSGDRLGIFDMRDTATKLSSIAASSKNSNNKSKNEAEAKTKEGNDDEDDEFGHVFDKLGDATSWNLIGTYFPTTIDPMLDFKFFNHHHHHHHHHSHHENPDQEDETTSSASSVQPQNFLAVIFTNALTILKISSVNNNFTKLENIVLEVDPFAVIAGNSGFSYRTARVASLDWRPSSSSSSSSDSSSYQLVIGGANNCGLCFVDATKVIHDNNMCKNDVESCESQNKTKEKPYRTEKEIELDEGESEEDEEEEPVQLQSMFGSSQTSGPTFKVFTSTISTQLYHVHHDDDGDSKKKKQHEGEEEEEDKYTVMNKNNRIVVSSVKFINHETLVAISEANANYIYMTVPEIVTCVSIWKIIDKKVKTPTTRTSSSSSSSTNSSYYQRADSLVLLRILSQNQPLGVQDSLNSRGFDFVRIPPAHGGAGDKVAFVTSLKTRFASDTADSLSSGQSVFKKLPSAFDAMMHDFGSGGDGENPEFLTLSTNLEPENELEKKLRRSKVNLYISDTKSTDIVVSKRPTETQVLDRALLSCRFCCNGKFFAAKVDFHESGFAWSEIHWFRTDFSRSSSRSSSRASSLPSPLRFADFALLDKVCRSGTNKMRIRFEAEKHEANLKHQHKFALISSFGFSPCSRFLWIVFSDAGARSRGFRSDARECAKPRFVGERFFPNPLVYDPQFGILPRRMKAFLIAEKSRNNNARAGTCLKEIFAIKFLVCSYLA